MTVLFCKEFVLVALNILMQFKIVRPTSSSRQGARDVHIHSTAQHSIAEHSTLVASYQPHHHGVSGAAVSLCSSCAQQTTASPSRFCEISAATCQALWHPAACLQPSVAPACAE